MTQYDVSLARRAPIAFGFLYSVPMFHYPKPYFVRILQSGCFALLEGVRFQHSHLLTPAALVLDILLRGKTRCAHFPSQQNISPVRLRCTGRTDVMRETIINSRRRERIALWRRRLLHFWASWLASTVYRSLWGVVLQQQSTGPIVKISRIIPTPLLPFSWPLNSFRLRHWSAFRTDSSMRRNRPPHYSFHPCFPSLITVRWKGILTSSFPLCQGRRWRRSSSITVAFNRRRRFLSCCPLPAR